MGLSIAARHSRESTEAGASGLVISVLSYLFNTIG
jgi:hypothetical protein